MSGRRTSSRMPWSAWGLPAILLSAIFMLITAGLPATATFGAQAREHSLDVHRELIGSTVLVGVGDLPDGVTKLGYAPNEPGHAPPRSSMTDVDPLDLYLVHWSGRPEIALFDTTPAATDPDRGPPAAGL